MFVQPLIDEYDLEVDSCGHNGAWAKLVVADDRTLHIRREVSDLKFKAYARGTIYTSVTERAITKRDEKLGSVLVDELGGFESLSEALQQHEDLRVVH